MTQLRGPAALYYSKPFIWFSGYKATQGKIFLFKNVQNDIFEIFKMLTNLNQTFHACFKMANIMHEWVNIMKLLN